MADGSSTAPTLVGAPEIAAALRISARGVRKRAAREGWATDSRRVSGGLQQCYREQLLPEDVRAALQRARATAAAASAQLHADGVRTGRRLDVSASIDNAVAQRNRERGAAEAAGLTGVRRARMDAKLDVLSRLGAFAQVRGLGVCAAMAEFCQLYAAGAIAVADSTRAHVDGTLHPATLRTWRRLLKTKGPAALAGEYGNRAGTGLLDTNEALRSFVIGVIAAKPHISGTLVHQALAARFPGEALPVVRSVQRWIDRWKTQNAEAFLLATNPDAWKNRHMAAFGNAAEGITRACQLWQLDSTPADLLLEDGRYSLVGVIDVAWRGFRLHVTKTSNADAVSQLLRRAILEWGVPEVVKVDNGSDYASESVARLLAGLHVEAQFSTPFSPWEKPFIERHFRTFSHSLLELLPGYVGHNVADAQAIRARESFADRLFQKNAVVEIKLTAAELQVFCDRWCEDYYQHKPHTGLQGDTPFQRYAQLRDVVRRVGDVRALDLLLGAGEMRTVTKKGLKLGKLNYIAPELACVTGQQVLVRVDDADVGRAVVYHGEQFLCVAECPEVLGVSRREIAIESKAKQAAAMQEARAQLKSAKRKASTGDLAREILDRRAEEAAALATLPAPNVVHMTPALAAASEAADALDRVVSDLDKRLGPTTEAHFAEVRELIHAECAADESGTSRFGRALRAMAAPENEIEAQWLKHYRTSSEFRGAWMVFESFGASPFGLDDDFNRFLPEDAPFKTEQGAQ